jgi:Arginase/agmatinase/formimionoglutamate hydrolase, arginase family
MRGMRRKAVYPSPSYTDKHDKRIISIIRHSELPQTNAVNILGIPFDGATLGRKGSSAAPQAIRESLRFNSNFNPELGISLENARIYDLGDVVLKSKDVRAVHSQIKKEVSKCILHSSFLVILGGDNSISLPSITALSEHCESIGLIVLDSHYDLRGEISGRPTSGSSYYLAMKRLGKKLKGRVAYIGQHGFLNSSFYASRAERMGITVFTALDVMNEGAYRIARAAYSIASNDAECIYLSIDIDCSGEVTGVSAPSPAGISSRDIFTICNYIASSEKLLAADIVETSPPLDPTGRSQLVASSAICYLASGFEMRKLNKA